MTIILFLYHKYLTLIIYNYRLGTYWIIVSMIIVSQCRHVSSCFCSFLSFLKFHFYHFLTAIRIPHLSTCMGLPYKFMIGAMHTGHCSCCKAIHKASCV